jgi:hypothetical protein
MKTMFRLLIVGLFLAGWGIAALALHVVRARGDAIVVIPKQRLHWRDTYVDAREWTLNDVANHPSVVQRIVQSGNAEHFAYLLGDGNRSSASDVAAALEDAVRNAPPTTKPEDKHGMAQQAKATLGALWEKINK